MTKQTEQDIGIIIASGINNIIAQLPYNSQNSTDEELARYFANKHILKMVKPAVDKYERGVKASSDPSHEVTSENYFRTCKYGTPRRLFNRDLFITTLVETFKLKKHLVVELVEQSYKETKPPLSIDINYIGDK